MSPVEVWTVHDIRLEGHGVDGADEVEEILVVEVAVGNKFAGLWVSVVDEVARSVD